MAGADDRALLPGSRPLTQPAELPRRRRARHFARATCDSGAFESQGFTLTRRRRQPKRDHQTALSPPAGFERDQRLRRAGGRRRGHVHRPARASAAISGKPGHDQRRRGQRQRTANSIVGGPYNVVAARRADSVDFSLTNRQGHGTVMLSNLIQAYAGCQAREREYDAEWFDGRCNLHGSATAPTNAGSYTVAAP